MKIHYKNFYIVILLIGFSCENNQLGTNYNLGKKDVTLFDTLYCVNEKDTLCKKLINRKSVKEFYQLKSGDIYPETIWIFNLFYLDQSGTTTVGAFESSVSSYYFFTIEKDVFSYALVSKFYKPEIKKIEFEDFCFYEVRSEFKGFGKHFFTFNAWLINKNKTENIRLKYSSYTIPNSYVMDTLKSNLQIKCNSPSMEKTYNIFVSKKDNSIKVKRTQNKKPSTFLKDSIGYYKPK